MNSSPESSSESHSLFINAKSTLQIIHSKKAFIFGFLTAVVIQIVLNVLIYYYVFFWTDGTPAGDAFSILVLACLNLIFEVSLSSSFILVFYIHKPITKRKHFLLYFFIGALFSFIFLPCLLIASCFLWSALN